MNGQVFKIIVTSITNDRVNAEIEQICSNHLSEASFINYILIYHSKQWCKRIAPKQLTELGII